MHGFQQGGVYQVGVSFTGLYRTPSEHASLETEVLYGETVRIIGFKPDWAKVRAELDGYEGYVRLADLSASRKEAPTHRVSRPTAAVYASPDFKKGVVSTLYMNARVQVRRRVETGVGVVCEVLGLGWIFEHRLSPLSVSAADFVEEFIKLDGREYGWGRRSELFDCSSAVQAACIAAGIHCPRDVKDQVQMLGEPVEFHGRLPHLRRGDLVFWTEARGSHVAVMVGEEVCIHATIWSPYGGVLQQEITQVMADQEEGGNGPVTMIRRFPGYA